MATDMAVPFLGRLPLDPRIGNVIILLFLLSFKSTVEDVLDLRVRFTESVLVFSALN